MANLHNACYLCLFTLLLTLFNINTTKAQSPPVIKIAAHGEPTPIGGTFNLTGTYSTLDMNDLEDIAFVALIDSPAIKQSVFMASSSGMIFPVVSSGDSIAEIGRRVDNFSGNNVSINNAASVAFGSQFVTGGAFRTELLLSTDKKISKLVSHGDPFPEGGVIESPNLRSYSLNNSGAVAFEAFITPEPFRQAIFISNAGIISKAVATGDPSPVGGTFSFAYLRFMDFNDQGAVLFYDKLDNAGSKEGLFVSTGGTITKVAAEREASPDGNPYSFFSGVGSINNSGDIAFLSTVCDTNADLCYDGLFLYSGGAISMIARQGESLPTGGGTFIGFFGISLNDNKEVIFTASDENGLGIYKYSAGVIQKAVRNGESAPDGGSFLTFGSFPRLNAGGAVAFGATFEREGAKSGIFLWNGGPRLGLSEDTVKFTDIIPGQASKVEMQISNTGGRTLNVQEISVTPSPPFALEAVPSLPLSLEPGQKSQFLVTFQQSPAGRFRKPRRESAILEDGSLSIKTNAGRGTAVIPVNTAQNSALRVDIVPDEIKAGESATIEIRVMDQSNNVDKNYSGGATIRLLEDQSTAGITRIAAEQSVIISQGLSQPVFFFTPKEPFTADKPLNENTVLSGKAVLEVKLENSNIPAVTKQINVRSPLDFFIEKIEVQQGVLNTDKDVIVEFKPGITRTFAALPFISEHNTAVRIIVGYNNTLPVPFSTIELPGITGSLKISRDGNQIKTVNDIKAGGHSSREFKLKDKYDENEQDLMYDALFTFLSSTDLENPGTYTLDAELKMVPNLEETASDKANNTKSYSASFTQTKPLRVLSLVGVPSGQKPDSVDAGIWNDLKDLYPIQNSKLIVNDPNSRIYYFSGGTFFSDIKFGTLTNILDRYNKENPSDQRELLVMFTPMDIAREICSNLEAGGCAESIKGRVSVLGFTSDNAAVHELGHLLGLRDTYKTDKYRTRDGEPNPRRSNAANPGNPVEEGNINLSNRNKAVPGNSHFDFMGSIANWVDRVTWDYLYRTKFDPALGTNLAMNSSKSDNGFIAVSGTVDTFNTVTFNPFLTLSQVPEVSVSGQAGPYTLEFQDNTGTTLGIHSFDVEFNIPDAGDQQTVPFSFYLQLPEGTSKLVLKKNGTDIADRLFSANAPAVQMIFPQGGESLSGELPLEWTASDPDGGNITYDILYCPNGKDQIVLAVNLDSTSYVWNTGSFPSSASGSITIIANDGINEGRAEAANLVIETPVVGVEEITAPPKQFSLSQNYPNPFNPSTSISFDVPVSSYVILIIYNIQGLEIRRLAEGTFAAGRHTAVWDSRDNHGQKVSSGTYFIQMRTGEFAATKKVVILK